jgi:hypothetical protein
MTPWLFTSGWMDRHAAGIDRIDRAVVDLGRRAR